MKRFVFVLAAFLSLPAYADCDFREATASQAFLLGPFVDATDGVTVEPGLTIANTDIRIGVAGGNIVAKTSGGATYDESGMYATTFDATDTAAVGNFQIQVLMSGAAPVFHECVVLGAQEYDRKYGTVDNLNGLDVGLIEGQTTVATLATQVSFTLTAGPTNDDALNGALMVAVGGTEKGWGFVDDYTGSSKTVALVAGVQFTLEVADDVRFFAVPGDLDAAITAIKTAVDGNATTLGTPTDTDIATDIANVQTAVDGTLSADVVSISGDSTAADNLESYTDGTTEQDVNVKCINGALVQGDGSSGDKWDGDGTSC